MSRPRVRLDLPEAYHQARLQLRKMNLPSGVRDLMLCLLNLSQHHGKAYGCFPYRRTLRRTLFRHYGRVSRTRVDVPELVDHERLAESTLGDWIRGAEGYGLMVRQLRYHQHRTRWNRSTLYLWGPVLWSLSSFAWKIAAARAKAEAFRNVKILVEMGIMDGARSAFKELFPRLSFDEHFLEVSKT